MTGVAVEVELTGRAMLTESAPGGGLRGTFRVDCAEGQSKYWAWRDQEEVPRFWRLVIPKEVLVESRLDCVASRRLRVLGVLSKDNEGCDQIDALKVRDIGAEATE